MIAEELEGNVIDLEGHELVALELGHTDTDHTTFMDLTCGAFGSSSAASFLIARCQSQVSRERRYRRPASSPSHQIGQEHFV